MELESARGPQKGLSPGTIAHRYPHRHGAFRHQHYARNRFRVRLGRTLESGGTDKRGEHGGCLDECEGSTDADPGAGAKWNELISRETCLVFRRETGRIEPVRVIPQLMVTVDHVNRQTDKGAGLDGLSGQIDIFCGSAGHHRYRRIESHRLLQDLL